MRQNDDNPKGIESISPALEHPPPLRFGEARKRLQATTLGDEPKSFTTLKGLNQFVAIADATPPAPMLFIGVGVENFTG